MIKMEQIPLTPLAEYIGKLIRERGGYIPSVGGESWLEKKAGEIRKLVWEEMKGQDKGERTLKEKMIEDLRKAMEEQQ